MTDSTDRTLVPGRRANWDFTFAFWALRLWLGARALFVGIEKYGAYKSVAQPLIDPATGQPDASGVMINVNIKHYAWANYSGLPAGLKDKFAGEPLLPHPLLVAFDRFLGPALLLTGFMLLLGIGSRVALSVQGLIYIALSAGLILIKQDDGISWLGIHVALVAFALTLVRYNRLALLKKW